MEGLCYLIGVIVLLVFAYLFLKLEHKREHEEILRRETIKNSLCDIATYLRIVADYYVKKDIR